MVIRRGQLLIGAGVLAVVAIVAVLILVRGGKGHALDVSVGYSGLPENVSECVPGDAFDRRMAGTRISVADAEGTTLGVDSTTSGGEYSESDDTCLWTVSIPDLEDSDAYTLTVQGPDGDEQDIDYSRSELEEEDWAVVLTLTYNYRDFQ